MSPALAGACFGRRTAGAGEMWLDKTEFREVDLDVGKGI
jgi:hypothetical protein